MAEKQEKGKRGRPARPKEPIVVPEGLPKGKVIEVNISEINLKDRTFEFRVAYKVSDLKKSIQKDGLQFPVILRGEKPYQLVSGFRRIRACQELEMEKVMAIVRDDLNEDQAFSLSWLENEVSKSLSPLDRANAVVKLKEQGKSTDEIASLYGLSDRQIQRYQNIADFPDVLKKALKDDDSFNSKHGLLLAQAFKKDPKLDLKAWIGMIKEEDLSAEALKKRLAKEVKKAKRPKKLIDKRKNSFRMFPFAFNPESTTDGEKQRMIKALEEALGMLKSR